MKKMMFVLFVASVLAVTGCATVTVTKTGMGFQEPTIPDKVEILMTLPKRDFVELATVASSNWKLHQTAKMHNSMRAKCAPLGSDAVVITASGIAGEGLSTRMWTTGVAIRYTK